MSQCIIGVYLYAESASLLVLVPQLAFTTLLAWKLARAAGLVFGVRYGVVPTVRYDAALAATATASHTHEYDRQAIAFVSALMAPLLLGFVAHALVYEREAAGRRARAQCTACTHQHIRPRTRTCRVHRLAGLGADDRGGRGVRLRLCADDAAAVDQLQAA